MTLLLETLFPQTREPAPPFLLDDVQWSTLENGLVLLELHAAYRTVLCLIRSDQAPMLRDTFARMCAELAPADTGDES